MKILNNVLIFALALLPAAFRYHRYVLPVE